MKVLSTIEIQNVSGGYSWDFSSYHTMFESVAKNFAECVSMFFSEFVSELNGVVNKTTPNTNKNPSL